MIVFCVIRWHFYLLQQWDYQKRCNAFGVKNMTKESGGKAKRPIYESFRERERESV